MLARKKLERGTSELEERRDVALLVLLRSASARSVSLLVFNRLS